MPVDYHGWTHAPKEQGGTDPIPVAEGGGGTPLAMPWGTANNETTPTNVGDSSTYTLITLSDFELAGGQTAISQDGATLSVDEDGIYLIEVNVRWNSGAGTGTWAQGALTLLNAAGTIISRHPTPKIDPLTFSSHDQCSRTYLFSYPGEHGSFRRFGVSGRQVGGGTTQTPTVTLSIIQITPTFDGVPGFLNL